MSKPIRRGAGRRQISRRPRRALEQLEARHVLDSVVVFNELMYHPTDAGEGLEWIELHNQQSVDVDLSGWSLAGGVDFKFAAGTTIPGRGYLVVAATPAALQSAAGITGVLGPYTGKLDNSGENITLRDNNQRELDSIDYKDDGEWPVSADGSGASLAKRAGDLASAPAASWTTSAQIDGTPGKENFPPVNPSSTSTTLVQLNSTWKYEQSGVDLGTNWRQSAYNDASWASAAAVFSTTASAAGTHALSINFDANTYNVGANTAGVVSVGNWNDILSGAVANRVLKDNSGSNTGATLSVASHQITDGQGTSFAQTGDTRMMRGHIYEGGSQPVDVTIGGTIPYSKYDVYVYFNSSVVTNQQTFTIVGSGQSITALETPGVDTSFVQATAATNGNYVVFTNQTAANFVIRAQGAGGANQYGYFNGLQIVDRTPPTASLTPGPSTYYFRQQFNYTPGSGTVSLAIAPIVDDGAVYYLNGVEIYRQNMPDGAIGYSTYASSPIGTATQSAPITVPAGSLLSGSNVLAVELHQSGPTPGDIDAVFGTTLVSTLTPPIPPVVPKILFNEIAAAASPSFAIEIVNNEPTSKNLAGYEISSPDIPGSSYVIPAGTNVPSGGYLTVTAAQLGFSPTAGQALFLFTPSRTSVTDGVTIRAELRGRAAAHNNDWLFPDVATLGAANHFSFHSEIVINEIMYHHRPVVADGPIPYQASAEEWVELYNRGSQTVDLSGWRFDNLIDYNFPAGTTLGAGQYLVVAKDADALRLAYPSITILGNYRNSLTNSGGLVVLKDATGNPADEVQYYDGGNWPQLADGGGSSLELRDPDADNSRPEAWQASDESGKSQWHTYTSRRIAQPYLGSFQSTVGSPVPPSGWNEFIFGLLESGEVLLDDIRVVENPTTTATQLITNGTFETDAVGGAPAAWRFGGNHQAAVITDPANPSNKVMRITATGTTGYMSNEVETTFLNNTPIVVGREYEVSFRAKWVNGSQQLNNRAYFTSIPATTIVEAPTLNGTPGAVNSRNVANAGPTYSNLQNSPAVPAANQSVTVTVQVADPDGVGLSTLYWSVAGGAWQSVTMTLNNGQLSGVIPGQAAGAVVQFYVQSQDLPGAISMYPTAGPAARALYQVNDGGAAPAVALGIDSYRVIMTAADTNFMFQPTNLMSDAALGATVVINESQILYNVGVTIKGSQHSRGSDERVGFSIEVSPEQALRGIHQTFAIDRSSRSLNTPKPSPDEIIVKQFLNHAGGIASEYDDLIYVIAPKSSNTSVATLQMARLGSVYLDSQYKDGGNSPIYEYEMMFTSPGTVNGQPDGEKLETAGPFADYDIEYLGADKELYRFHMQKENARAEDDFSKIIALGQALELTGPALDAAAEQVLDVDQWMRTFAARSLTMDFDGYGSTTYRHNHNLKLYVRPGDEKVLAFLWDVDGAFNLAPTDPLYPHGPTNLTKLIERPDNLRRFYGNLQDMINTTWNSTYMGQWMAHYSVKSGQNLSANLSLVQQRADYVTSQLPLSVPFTVDPLVGNADVIDTNTPTITLRGTAWINVDEIRIQGRAEPIKTSFSDVSNFQTTVALKAGANVLTFQAYDYQGNLVGTDTITVNTTTGTPEPQLRVTEVMYHPAGPTAGELAIDPTFTEDDFEFIEIKNIGATAVNLSGVKILNGITFNFINSAFTTLQSGEYALVVESQAGFAARYNTAGLHIAGEYSGNLSNGGETLELLDGLGQTIQAFTYDDTGAGWHPTTDGDGPSLVIIDPLAATATWNQGASWRPSAQSGGSPGLTDPSPVSVVNRQLFYNNSKFDGNNAAAAASDDAAIATDKAPLFKNQTATLANYSSFSRGINGLMVDITNLPLPLTLAQFAFRVGNENNLATWTTAPAPLSLNIRSLNATTSRATLVWTDGAIRNKWLEVTLTIPGLATPDVFYFGNMVGESGNSALNANVDASDEISARNNLKTFITPATITDHNDFNRDGFVNAADQIMARGNIGSLALLHITGFSLTASSPPESNSQIAVGILHHSAPMKPFAANATAAENATSVETNVARGAVFADKQRQMAAPTEFSRNSAIRQRTYAAWNATFDDELLSLLAKHRDRP